MPADQTQGQPVGFGRFSKQTGEWNENFDCKRKKRIEEGGKRGDNRRKEVGK